MRAAQGAASSAQATDRSLPGRPESSFPPLGLLSPPNPLRWASAGAPVTASASQWGGWQCRPGLCPVCTAHRRHEPPYWGAQGGRSPPALLSLHFFGKKWGPRPGRPVPRGAPRCENVEPLIRPSVRTGAPSPCGGKASGGGYPPLRARRLIRVPGPPCRESGGASGMPRPAAGRPRLSQISSFWGILGRESKPFWRSSSVGMESLILPLR